MVVIPFFISVYKDLSHFISTATVVSRVIFRSLFSLQMCYWYAYKPGLFAQYVMPEGQNWIPLCFFPKITQSFWVDFCVLSEFCDLRSIATLIKGGLEKKQPFHSNSFEVLQAHWPSYALIYLHRPRKLELSLFPFTLFLLQPQPT